MNCIEKWRKRKAEEARAEEIERLRAELENEKQRNDDLEAAAVELADMVAAQDDALVELAGLIEE